MLIEFKFENWRSFRNETIFSMEAGQQHKHRDRLALIKALDVRLTPAAAIYGGNAAGKTNFIAALRFVKSFILDGAKGDEPIPLDQFAMETADDERPSSFALTILAEERVFRYGFSVNRSRVISEELVEIRKFSKRVLFHRATEGDDSGLGKREDSQFLEGLMSKTSDRELFLTSSSRLDDAPFLTVFNWFKYNLDFVVPDVDARSGHSFSVIESSAPEKFSHDISKLDTGIARIRFEKVDAKEGELSIPVPNLSKEMMRKRGVLVLMAYRGGNGSMELHHIGLEDGELACYEWQPVHTLPSGEEFIFKLDKESAGTKRLFEIMSVFLPNYSAMSNKVYVVDELDRSMHTRLTLDLLQTYLLGCTPETRNQMLFTTHDTWLIDQEILRRDEMWVTERRRDGSSKMWSFDDFEDIRSDKDLRKSYLNGELGGIPRLLPISAIPANM